MKAIVTAIHGTSPYEMNWFETAHAARNTASHCIQLSLSLKNINPRNTLTSGLKKYPKLEAISWMLITE